MPGMSLHRLATAAGLIGCGMLLAACDRGAPAPTQTAAPAPTATAPAVATPPPAPAESDQAMQARIVKEAMTQQYGDQYDAKHRCWAYTTETGDDGQEGGERYCMRAGEPHLVESGGQRQLYFAAASAVDIQQPEYSYGHPAPGLMGAFQLALDPAGTWKLLAGDKAMTFGSSGNCGCDAPQFLRIGADRHAWKFSSGGVWQGIVVGSYSLIAPLDGKMLDLSAIPQITEDDQDSEYDFSVDASDPAKPFYPLQVTRTREKVVGQPVAVEFDPAKRQYALPSAE